MPVVPWTGRTLAMGILQLVPDLLSKLSSDVASLVNQSATILQTVLCVNFWLVRWILDITVSTLHGMWYAGCSLCYAVSCALEEFAWFVSDLIAIVFGALEVINSGLMQTYRGLQIAYSGIAYVLWIGFLFGDSVWRGVAFGVTQIGGSIKTLLSLISRSLTLLGEAGVVSIYVVPRGGWALLDVGRTCIVALMAKIRFCIIGLFEIVQAGSYLLIVESRYACLGFFLLCSLLLMGKYIYIHGMFGVLVTRWTLAMIRLRHLLWLVLVWPVISYIGRIREQRQASLLQPTSSASSPESETDGNTEVHRILRPTENLTATSTSNQSTKLPLKNRKQITEEVKELTGLRVQLERIRENTICVVCQDSPRCITLLPCRHFCLCQACTSRILTHQTVCPICRSAIREVLHVYS